MPPPPSCYPPYALIWMPDCRSLLSFHVYGVIACKVAFHKHARSFMIVSTLSILCDALTNQSTNLIGVLDREQHSGSSHRDCCRLVLSYILRQGDNSTLSHLCLAIEACKEIMKQWGTLQWNLTLSICPCSLPNGRRVHGETRNLSAAKCGSSTVGGVTGCRGAAKAWASLFMKQVPSLSGGMMGCEVGLIRGCILCPAQPSLLPLGTEAGTARFGSQKSVANHAWFAWGH